jgi:hypothetical protein
MERTIGLAALVIGLVACGTPQKKSEPDTVQMKETAIKEIEPPSEVEPPPEQPEPPAQPEELAVQMFEVAPDQPAETDEGLQIRMDAGAPDWRFSFVRNGETQSVQYNGVPLYIEGVAFGQLFVISRPANAVQVTLRSDAPSQPLPEATAADIARTEQKTRLGCEGEAKIETEPNGTLVLDVPNAPAKGSCRIVVGRYTGEVVDL